MREIWREIFGIEVSNLGDVRGAYPTQNGAYLRVQTTDGPKLLHRLVCEAFHGPAPTDKPLALHWDDDPLNNDCSNLRWGSAQDNADDMKRNNAARGLSHSNSAYRQTRTSFMG